MAWLSSLLAKLWPFRRRVVSSSAAAIVAGPNAPALEGAIGAIAIPVPIAEALVEAAPAAALQSPPNPYAVLLSDEDLTAGEDGDEDEASGDDDGDEPLDEEIGPDPFVTTEAQVIVPLAEREIFQERRAARAEALRCEHRIYISTVAGPGSLAEALNTLLAEGLVTAQFVDQGAEASFILYTPVTLGDEGHTVH